MSAAVPLWGLWTRDGGVCWVCREHVPYPQSHENRPLSATRDHVIPQRDGGGRLGDDNIRLAHMLCNQYRDRYAPKDLAKVIRWMRDGLSKGVALAAVEEMPAIRESAAPVNIRRAHHDARSRLRAYFGPKKASTA